MMQQMLLGLQANAELAGHIEYTTPGYYWFTVPDGVEYISIVCVGGGGGAAKSNNSRTGPQGGGGGALRYANYRSTTPGEQLRVRVGPGGLGGGASGSNMGGFGQDSYLKRIGTGLDFDG